MRKEELDKLKEKYFAGETSLEEEHRLKELDTEGYFSSLKNSEQTMDWDFDSFVATNTVQEKAHKSTVLSLKRSIILISNIAASVLLGFFIANQWINVDSSTKNTELTFHETDVPSIEKHLDSEPKIITEAKEKLNVNITIEKTKATIHKVSPTKRTASKEARQAVDDIGEDEMFVE